MRKNIAIVALYIVGMFAAVGPYLWIDRIFELIDPYQIIAFIVTYLTILLFLSYFIVQTLKKDFSPFMRRIWVHLGIVVGTFALAFLFSIIANVILLLLGITEEAANQGGLIDMIRNATTSELVLLILLFTIFVPILEELVYRKAVYGIAKQVVTTVAHRMKPEMDVIKTTKIAAISAIILSGLIFGLVHIQGDPIYLLHYGVVGIILGTSYYLSKENIYVPLLVHIIQNTVGVVQIIILIQLGLL